MSGWTHGKCGALADYRFDTHTSSDYRFDTLKNASKSKSKTLKQKEKALKPLRFKAFLRVRPAGFEPVAFRVGV